MTNQAGQAVRRVGRKSEFEIYCQRVGALPNHLPFARHLICLIDLFADDLHSCHRVWLVVSTYLKVKVPWDRDLVMFSCWLVLSFVLVAYSKRTRRGGLASTRPVKKPAGRPSLKNLEAKPFVFPKPTPRCL